MTHWRKVLQTEHLNAADIEKGTNVKIERMSTKVVTGVNDTKKDMPVAHFEGFKKAFPLNATNCKTLHKLSGSGEMEKWVGMTVTLTVKQVKAFGEVTDAIRILPVLPKKAAPADKLKSAIEAIGKCKSIAELKSLFEGLDSEVRNNQQVVAAKDKKKGEL